MRRLLGIIIYSILLVTLVLIISKINGGDFKPCNNQKIFAVDDYLYGNNVFRDYLKVTVNPKYPGGERALQEYFENAVKFSGDESSNVIKYQIIFIVNCMGQIGKVELKSKPEKGFEKVVQACEKMSNWIPASRNDSLVDCFYRLGFTNQAGKLVVEYNDN